MHEQHLSAKEAALESMQEISGALVGITLVLTAVFIPMAFFGGSTGVIYRQFSITLVAAMSLSLMVALILTPALCALILKPNPQPVRWASWFNQELDNLKDRYVHLSTMTLQHKAICLVLFIGLIGIFALFYRALPTSFLPSEDQGILSLQIRLQEGAPMKNTIQVGEQVRQYFLEQEKANINLVMIRYGRNFSGTGQNLATGFVALKHWDDRSGGENTAQAIRERAMAHFRDNPNAQINISMPASVNGLGQTDGLDFWIRDINGNGRQYLEEQFQNMQASAAQYSSFENLEDRKSTRLNSSHV